jgi:hypothetical protein
MQYPQEVLEEASAVFQPGNYLGQDAPVITRKDRMVGV